MTRQELLNRLIVLYGGRSAEELVFGEVTTGASDDIRKASDLARRMVSQFGMSEHLGPIDYGGERPNPFGVGGAGRDIAISERTAREIDEEVRHLLQDAWRRARRILAAHRPLMDRMAAHLLEREVLERDDLAAFLAEVGTIDLTEEIGSPPVA
jgi:cell division protease FtsH